MANDWRLNARVGTSMSFWCSDWHRYSAGYLEAGRVALAHLHENPRQRDCVVFPIVFLFRHFLELRLKEVILRAGILLGEQEQIVKDHSLAKLWKRARPRIEETYPDNDRGILDRVEAALCRINALDEDSMRFRYPVTLSGEPSIAAVDYLNAADVVDDLEEAIELLDHVTKGLLVALDYTSERGGGGGTAG